MSGLLAPDAARDLPRQCRDPGGLQHLQGRQGRRLPRHRRHGRARRQRAPDPRQRGDPRRQAVDAQALQGRGHAKCRPARNAAWPSRTTRTCAPATSSSASASRRSSARCERLKRDPAASGSASCRTTLRLSRVLTGRADLSALTPPRGGSKRPARTARTPALASRNVRACSALPRLALAAKHDPAAATGLARDGRQHACSQHMRSSRGAVTDERQLAYCCPHSADRRNNVT